MAPPLSEYEARRVEYALSEEILDWFDAWMTLRARGSRHEEQLTKDNLRDALAHALRYARSGEIPP